MKSVYIHIPFCKNICSYCDFPKMYYYEDIVDKYLIKLEEEIKKTYKNELVETIYIGGGTPNSLNIKQLNKLFDITNIFNKSDNLEFSIEVNSELLNEEQIRLFSERKINRISIGVQSINKKILKLLNRDSKEEVIENNISLLKKYNITNINIDLMYGINNQTLEDLKVDLDFIKSLDIKHVSLYSLILEKNTKLYLEKYEYIDDEIEYEMYKYIINYLEKLGFIHYEISNFSKKGFFSKHNLVYWSNNKYYGFGLGSSSYIDSYRYTNTKSITKYLDGNIKFDEEYISKNREMEYEVITSLRKIEGINLTSFKNKFGVSLLDYFDIENEINKEYLIIKNDYMYINKDKLFLSNQILLKFIKEGNNE